MTKVLLDTDTTAINTLIDANSNVSLNTEKVTFSKTNIKGTINHGATAGTTRPTDFDSVEWIGSVEPTNATNDDTWINTT